VPTKNDILVPETILKKRKSQEKEREQRAADLDKKRKVCSITQSLLFISTICTISPFPKHPLAK
jgi:large subunit ribosomal protein L7e